MACELREKEFQNSEGEPVLVTCRQLSASKALDLHLELMGKVGVAVLPFIEDKFNFGDIIHLMRFSDADITKRIICMANIDGMELKPALFDMKFDGGKDLMLAYKIFGFVLHTNFYDFFKQGVELNEQRRLEAEAISAPEEPKNSSPKI